MAKVLSKIIRPLASLLALVSPSFASNPPAPELEAPTLQGLIGRLQQDETLRLRFSSDPRAVLVEAGVDPAQFDLPAGIAAEQLGSFLRDWSGPSGPSSVSQMPIEAVPAAQPEKLAAAVVPLYGVPPTPRPNPGPLPPKHRHPFPIPHPPGWPHFPTGKFPPGTFP